MSQHSPIIDRNRIVERSIGRCLVTEGQSTVHDEVGDIMGRITYVRTSRSRVLAVRTIFIPSVTSGESECMRGKVYGAVVCDGRCGESGEPRKRQRSIVSNA